MKRSASGSLLTAPSSSADLKATLEALTKEQLIERAIENETKMSKELELLREDLQKSKRRENLAVLRLAVKEKLTAELTEEVEAMRQSCAEERKPDRMMADHLVGQLFIAMRDGFREARKEAKLAKLELKAAKGGRESAEAAKLAARCSCLEEENKELKANTQKIARLETLLAYSNKTIESLRRRQRDISDIVAEHDAEVNRFQEELMRLQEENQHLREMVQGPAKGDGEEQEGSTSRPESTTHVSTPSHLEENQDDADSDADNAGLEEMVTAVSSPEPEGNEREQNDNLSDSDDDLTAAGHPDEVITVSSPEQEAESGDVVTVSSPEPEETAGGSLSDEND